MSSRLKSRITRRVLGRGVKDFLKKADSFLQRTKLLSYVGSALNLTQGNKNMERQTETSSTSTCGSSSLMRRSLIKTVTDLELMLENMIAELYNVKYQRYMHREFWWGGREPTYDT